MANETASKSEWKTICERGNMALQFHVLPSEGQRYQLLSPHCAHTRMCLDIPSRCAVEAGGSWSLESRQRSGARCVPARAPWERWGRTAGSRQKEARWRSGDWCLGITAKWLPCWPLAGVHVNGNKSQAEEPGPISGELWQECMSGAIKKRGSRTDGPDLTPSRPFLWSVGGVRVLTAMARSCFPELCPRSG